MNDEIAWHLELSIAPNQIDEFRASMEEMVASTQEESGTLAYAWYISDDNTEVHIIERYRDSAAVMTHMSGFGEKFAGRFLALVQPKRWSVFGNPNDEARRAFANFGPSYYALFGGFAR